MLVVSVGDASVLVVCVGDLSVFVVILRVSTVGDRLLSVGPSRPARYYPVRIQWCGQ